jgi:acetolactate synthase-1/2/3 large subunit
MKVDANDADEVLTQGSDLREGEAWELLPEQVSLTGGEIVAEMLARAGIPYLVGIAGHGNLGLVDALRRRADVLPVIMPRHEQSAVHIADGYYRAARRPLACYTSIGPGAINAAVGVATAHVDSIPVLVITGGTHVHMRGTGVLQELERRVWSEGSSLFEACAKRVISVDHPRQLPRAMSSAFRTMMTGRPGPVVLDVPMDVQSATATVLLPRLSGVFEISRPRADGEAVRRAAELLVSAKRPVLLLGGGAMLANAGAVALEVAEHLGAVIVTTMQGKGVIPESHPLFGGHPGSNGTSDGNAHTRDADVLLALGVRFADKATSSYRHGVTFAIPPTRLIQVDVDPAELGKNYPVELGVTADVGSFLVDLLGVLKSGTLTVDSRLEERVREIGRARGAWRDSFRELRESDASPITMARALAEIRAALPADAFVLTSSGNTQVQVFQEMTFEVPGTYISSGGFSTMGWSLPAAIGVKLAHPDRPVVAIVGDGDFLMTVQELATAVQYKQPVIVVVFNSFGWQSIRDLQTSVFGKGSEYATDFRRDGFAVSPDLAGVARAFGATGVQVRDAGQLGRALETALACQEPTVIEVFHDTSFGLSGGQQPGWWDVPVPAYSVARRTRYEAELAEERV